MANQFFQTPPEKTIRINLKRPTNYTDLTSDNLVHNDVYELLKTKIRLSILQKQRKTPNEEYPLDSGNVFFIDGSRGAGKTTFLKTAYECLPQDVQSLAKLDYIDPTRLEGSEILLINILRSIKELVIKETKSCLDNEDKKLTFRDNFKALAGGLSLLRAGHDPLAHHDPDLFFERGLTRAQNGVSLRKNFHSLISNTCSLLGKEALILAFDDADTNSRHAFKLLECIRTYLDTPELIILTTGDLELYSLLVRNNFSVSIPTTNEEFSESHQTRRTRMLDHLEEQYLLKLFPLKHRFNLKPLGRLIIDGKKGHTTYRFTTGNQDRSTDSLVDEIIRRGLRIKKESDITIFKTHLLKQPLRSIVQVLQRCQEHLSDNDETGNTNNDWSLELSNALREALRDIALGCLYKHGISVDDLRANYLPSLTQAVFDLANKDGDVDTAAYLRPQAGDEDLNKCYIALSAEVAGLCAGDPKTAITYMLTGPGSVSLWGKEKRRISSGLDTQTKTLERQFRQYMAIGKSEDALNWARRATAIFGAGMDSSNQTAAIDFGVIALNIRTPGVKQDNFLTIDTAISQINYPPILAYSLLDVSGKNGRRYSSAYNIIGLITRLWGETETEKIKQHLSSTYPSKSISKPDWKDNSFTDEATDSPEENTETPPPREELIQSIIEWNEKIKTIKTYPSSILLGKIWIRIYFSLEKSFAKNRLTPSVRFDHCMKIAAACIINAFITEEASYDSGVYIDSSDPQTSTKAIAKKIKWLSENKNKAPLSYAISTCPIFISILTTIETNEANQLITEFPSLNALLTALKSEPALSNIYICGSKK